MQGAIVISEDFGNQPDGAPLTSSTGTSNGTAGTASGNTGFSYVRASSDVNSLLEAQSPGAFSGSSGLLLATGGSLAGIGSAGFTGFLRGTLSFSLGLPDAFAGNSDTFFFGVGSGTTFSANSTYVRSDLAFGFQIVKGDLQAIPSGTNPSLITLGMSQNYDISIQFNNGPVISDEMGRVLVPSGEARVYVNGTLVGTSFSPNNGKSVTALRFYSVNGLAAGGGYEIDNVLLQDAIVPVVPEPTVLGLLSGGLGLLGRRRRAA